jgi:hypothetical protein
MQPYNGS